MEPSSNGGPQLNVPALRVYDIYFLRNLAQHGAGGLLSVKLLPARKVAVNCSGDSLFTLPLFWPLLFKYRAEAPFVVR